MARQEHPVFKGFDAITFEIPSKRILRMKRSDYQPIGSLYSRYRCLRRTWVNEFRWPWGVFEKPAVSEFIREAEALASVILAVEFPKELKPLVEAMTLLAPALVDDRNDWQQFRDAMNQIRSSFEIDEGARFADNEPGRQRVLSQLHQFQKETEVFSPLQKGLRSVLFGFARAVGGRRKWKSSLNNWEHGVRVAQRFEIDKFSWTHRTCLIEARSQMVAIGRALDAVDGSSKAFHRTRIRNRATIIREISRLRLFDDRSFSALKRRIKASRKSGDWEAYLNKLPSRAYPKKRCVRVR